MSGFVFGLLAGLFVGIVLTAIYMLAAVSQRGFAENGWSTAWDMARQMRRWAKLAKDYDRLTKDYGQLTDDQSRTIETLMQLRDREKEQKQEG